METYWLRGLTVAGGGRTRPKEIIPSTDNDYEGAGLIFLIILAIVTAVAIIIAVALEILSRLIDGNLLIGGIIAVVGAIILGLIFYSLFPINYLKSGESLVNLLDLLADPAEKVYELEEQAHGGYRAVLGGIYAITYLPWSAYWVGGNEDGLKFPKKWLLGFAGCMVIMFGAINLMNPGDPDDEIVALVLAIYSVLVLISGLKAQVMVLKEVAEGTAGEFIVNLLCVGFFTVVGTWLMLTAIGYLVYTLKN